MLTDLQELEFTDIKHFQDLNIQLHSNVKNSTLTIIKDFQSQWQLLRLVQNLFNSDCRHFNLKLDGFRIEKGQTDIKDE